MNARRVLAVAPLALALGLLACSKDSSGPSLDIRGTYTLTHVDGRTLPATFPTGGSGAVCTSEPTHHSGDREQVFLSGSMVVHTATSATLHVVSTGTLWCSRVVTNIDFVMAYTVESLGNNTFRFTDTNPNAAEDGTVTIDGDVMTFDHETAQTLTLRR